MRQPKMKLTFETVMQKYYIKHINKLLTYIAYVNKVNIEKDNITFHEEIVKNHSILIKTIRYKGDLWLRVFSAGITKDNGFYFESPYIKTKN